MDALAPDAVETPPTPEPNTKGENEAAAAAEPDAEPAEPANDKEGTNAEADLPTEARAETETDARAPPDAKPALEADPTAAASSSPEPVHPAEAEGRADTTPEPVQEDARAPATELPLPADTRPPYYDDDDDAQALLPLAQGLPTNLLQLEHSFGLDLHRHRNVHVLGTATLAFAAGSTVVLRDMETGTQTYLRCSRGNGIGALAADRTGTYLAVGEAGERPLITIYEFPSLRRCRVLREGTIHAYADLAFNPEGDRLASVGGSPDYLLTVWAWRDEVRRRERSSRRESAPIPIP
jgi:hypothetical protein